MSIRVLAEGLVTDDHAERVRLGVMRSVADQDAIGPLDARTLLRLPDSGRGRLMCQAATLVADEYEGGGRLSSFESLAEQDQFDDLGNA